MNKSVLPAGMIRTGRYSRYFHIVAITIEQTQKTHFLDGYKHTPLRTLFVKAIDAFQEIESRVDLTLIRQGQRAAEWHGDESEILIAAENQLSRKSARS